jgi:TatD DNase family protein
LLVDTHCHLTFHTFDGDRQEVLERAREAGVRRILNPGIDLPSSREAVALAESQPDVYAAVGVHPNDAQTWEDDTLDMLRTLGRHPKVAAIGEIGLDYYWEKTPHDLQQEVFRRQLELAAELTLPVVIHTRNQSAEDPAATIDALEILSEWQAGLVQQASPLAERPGVLHSFSGDEPAARRAIEIHFWIGITGPVTFRNAPDLQQLVANLPPERLLIETDAPFLTPQPYRGRRNEPAYVRYVAEKIGELQGQSLETIAQITTANAERLFHW